LVLREASEAESEEEATAALDAALRELRHLTSLAIVPAPDPPPAALASLSSLQHCCLGDPQYGDANTAGAEAAAGLPDGPWRSSLRMLGASYGVLMASTAMLAGAHQLKELAVLGGSFECSDYDRVSRFWEVVAEHPSLMRLRVEAAECQGLPPALVTRLPSLNSELPDVEILCLSAFEDCSFYEDELNWLMTSLPVAKPC